MEEAVAHCRTTLQINPRSPNALGILAAIANGRGDATAAIAFWRRRLELQPDHVETLGLLAWDLATHPDAAVRKGTEAVALAHHAVQLSGARDPAVLDVLAAAYAETGRFPDAVATAGKALELAREQKNWALADVLRARMLVYRSGQPCRQTPPRPAIAP
jgi:cytochrome c-type biogenesis protein CcmH/NrfG